MKTLLVALGEGGPSYAKSKNLKQQRALRRLDP
jgi:hypothetical protein